MSDPSSADDYIIDVEYTDAGLRLVMDMDEWSEKIDDDFGTFESIHDFYRKPVEDLIGEFEEGLEEPQSDEENGEPGILIRDIPKEWQEDQTQLAEVLGLIHQQFVRFGLGNLISKELEDQKEFIENEQYKPLLIRQSAFYEDFLKLRSLLALQEQKGETLSTNEFNIIDRMGHRDRIRFAHLFGILSEEEHGILQEMASWRNKLAHNAWPEISSQGEAQIRSIAERVNEILKTELADEEMESSAEPDQQIAFDSGIGFEQLDTDLQLLQLSILDMLRMNKGSEKLDRIQTVLTKPDSVIRQRILRMDRIGYLQYEDGEARITDQGEQLLEEYWD